jgi:hypothetical protein
MNAVCYEVCDSIAIITFNRPDQLNSINAELRKGLYEAFERFEADDTARVGILTGAGSKAFCAGMDLKEAAQSGLGVPPRGFLPVIGQSVHLTKPTIAAVNGYWRKCATSASRPSTPALLSPSLASDVACRGHLPRFTWSSNALCWSCFSQASRSTQNAREKSGS